MLIYTFIKALKSAQSGPVLSIPDAAEPVSQSLAIFSVTDDVISDNATASLVVGWSNRGFLKRLNCTGWH